MTTYTKLKDGTWGIRGKGTPTLERPSAHSDGSACICRHVTTGSRLGAIMAHGRYWDESARKWLCFACGTTARIQLDDVRAAERGFYLDD